MKKKTGLILLILVLVFSNTMPAMAASASYTAASKAYKTYMSKRSVNGSKIVDVDKNGIPELLMKCKYNGYWYYTLCTYNKSTRKVVVLKRVSFGKDYPACFQYNTSKKQVYFNQESTGGMIETVFKVNGTKVSKVISFRSMRNYPGFTYTYQVNGKKVSYNTWSKKRTSTLKGFKNHI
ncbi:MAG: hypothetical protein Q4C91_17550 [Eubacteriales bacterium]|nr:hypothetical protein [Eubacteriales bacterium]